MYNCYTCKAKSECSGRAAWLYHVHGKPDEVWGDPRRRGTDPTAWSILPILRASAAGDRNGAFLQ